MPSRKEKRETVRTTHRQRVPILYWIVLAASVLAAIYAWVVFITTLNVHVVPTDTFMATLVGSTAMALFWITFILIRIVRSWPDRQATNRLCEQAVRLHRTLDDSSNTVRHGLLGEITTEANLYGRIVGIRMAICILNDWDPHTDADKEGPADDLVTAYREKTYPQELGNPHVTRETT